MRSVALVTGAASGIGLGLCRQLLAAGHTVIACPHSAGAEGLAELARRHAGRLSEIAMDVADEASVAAAARDAAKRVGHLDLLFNNAGIYPERGAGLDNLPAADILRAFEVNALGPLRVVGSMLPLLRRGGVKRIVNITSLMGSITDNTSGGSYAYRISKAALNMAVRNMAHELRREGFVCLTLHPGWVQTRMGGTGAPVTLDQAVAQILATTFGATTADNGTFKGPDGRTIPW